MDPEKKKRDEAVVLDTNIILASILKRGSYTRQVIVYLTDVLGVEAYTPEKTLQEIEEHLAELAKRKKIHVEELRVAVRILLLGVKVVGEQVYRDYLEVATNCVGDPADADFAALALHLAEDYERVILLTWNKKDYRGDCLETHRIVVATPSSLKI
ncbi:MAG: PIN domain-containing protein [Desulfurococcales archaeon]|nr:PIN domain-containing protein [Desulfurococcales archaeon]